MKSTAISLLLIVFLYLAKAQSLPCETKSPVIIEVENPILSFRTNEVITLSAEFVKEVFLDKKVSSIQVKDLKSNTLLITQSIDYNLDGIVDEFLFQSDFKPHEKKEFALSSIPKDSAGTSKVYAVFMESEDGMGDFTWENDFIGYRFYGQVREKLQGTGIAMDIWCKRTSDFLTEKWYAPAQNYHIDVGYGADHYNSGKNQGCGGSGIYANDTLYFSRPFSDWKIIANGPIRVVFELKFTGWTLNDSIVETKRVTLDAGHYFNKIESSYSPDIITKEFAHAVGFVQRDDSETIVEKDQGWMASWESLGEGNGTLGTGYIASASDIAEIINYNKHVVSLMYAKQATKITYYTGAVWSEFGSVDSLKDWVGFIENRTDCLFNPCKINLKQ
jgi:hypothetical protein